MKKIIFLLCTIAVIIIACQSNRSSVLAKPGDIAADEYTIDINKDTTLVTKNGALLKIPKGSLSSSSSSVTLEIKEAYSIEQMIRSGLTTQAGDEPLSSGGMIYINAKKGQDVKITQAIKVALPADYLDPKMQLFKGEETANGTVNWTDPVALPENKQLTEIDKGRQLFQANCTACHIIGENSTGPDLAHYLKDFPLGENFPGYYLHYPYNILAYPSDTIAKKHKDTGISGVKRNLTAVELYLCNTSSFSATKGDIYHFSQDEADAIYKYIQNESDRRNLPLINRNLRLDCLDSCVRYTTTKTELETAKVELEEKRKELVKGSPVLTEEIKNKTGSIPEPPPSVNFNDLVNPAKNKGVYYQFSIETFGWYNIDVLLSTQYGNTESELFVRVVGEYREKMDIFLIIPSTKIYAKGGKADDNTRYAFGFKNGKIFLPQNAKAYIMAVSESSSSVYFALKEFTTSTQQSLELELKAASKEEFNAAIASLNTDDLKIAVKDTKNADSIRKTETDLKNIETELKNVESLKPKKCDCDCLEPMAASEGQKTITVPGK